MPSKSMNFATHLKLLMQQYLRIQAKGRRKIHRQNPHIQIMVLLSELINSLLQGHEWSILSYPDFRVNHRNEMSFSPTEYARSNLTQI